MGQKWAKCTEDIPTTDPEIYLANLDISDPLHPILRRPEAPDAKTEAVESSPVQAESSSTQNRESLHSDSVAHLSGRISMSSRTSAMDGSWTVSVRTAIEDVSGQSTVDENGHCNASGGMTDAMDS